jgi:hypothetical protein
MPSFRMTVRFGQPQRYHVIDVDAGDLREAMRLAADGFPDDVAGTADLLEIRVQAEPDSREYTAP